MKTISRIALTAAAAALVGCPAAEGQDYFQLAIGNTWEYRVVDGGEEGERWNALSDDPDEHEDSPSGRGDLFFQMLRTYPDPGSSDLPDIEIQMRNFNVSAEVTIEGEVLGYQYKDVPADEGDRNEWFLKVPDTADGEYTESWTYEVPGETNSEVVIDVAQSWCSGAVATSFGTFIDCLEVERTRTTDFNNGELITTQVRREVWALGYGLVHYTIVAGDQDTTAGALVNTNVAPRPGSE